MFILFYYIIYEKQVFMDSLNYHIKWHRQLKHAMRLNLFILSPCDKKVQKECARKTEVQQNYRQWVVWSQIYMRFWLPLCNTQPAFPHWCKQNKKMVLGKQGVVWAVQVINLLKPKHTPGSDGGWEQGIKGQGVASKGLTPSHIRPLGATSLHRSTSGKQLTSPVTIYTAQGEHPFQVVPNILQNLINRIT